ncbi:hypothetical protein M406DRAFT_332932 [Cryphonectria parasitica EP155]|uniref:Uncharacterized protein n=1 Tax=Cryphonectria parasitica (strain ATCC 38755 / EP155) TaxID=660469 RepID=A0A9P4XXE3_CRYP1|nr:uncharacterized protein M406DRAFT_332932 [Cryphonectria parasitica EP155]KAF3762552.1 hypothetical protein M406DRAFT_332932 [Cryphonectria parasitica EP155]
MDTLIDLLPYHKQFKAAGLAVTSQSGPSNLRPKPQASFSDSGPVIGSLLPSFRKEPRQPSSRTHSDRKFSKGHIHPSLPTPAEPFLTLEDKLGRLDSYFDAPKSKTPQEQPDLQKTPLPLPACSARSTLTDKPLPRKPPIERRPIPARSGRRHMENTADWPTAGVLIHDHYPCPPCRDELSILSGDRQAAKAKATVSVQSWTSHGEFPQEPRRTPPSPPGQESKPETPPKDLPLKEDKSPAGCHQQPGHFAYGNHHKATGLRRRLTAKPPHCAPAAIRDDSEIISEDAKQLVSRQNEVQPERDPAPQLHVTLPGSSSSFEKALDAVVSKLDAMEDSRRYERKQNLEASQIEALNTATTPGYADLEGTSSKPSSTPHSQHPTLIAAQATRTASSDAVEGSDSGINDRDILIGLKMAICAACDEDLDAWIREKTGLRLRRFLADLKAFEIVSRERELSVPLPLSRRIRTHDKVNKRVESERERGKRVSKKWAPCFGADGQGLLPESSQEM